MTLNKLTADALADGTIDSDSIANNSIPIEKLSNVNLSIAPEVLEIQIDAPGAGQNPPWLWTWEQSTLPYARRTITNSPEVNVPLYKQGTYTVNNFAKTVHDSMTQTHTLYFKWVDGAGTDNLISWVTDQGTVTDSHPDINGGADTTVQRLSISVPAVITVPTLTAPTTVTYGVTNNGAGAYTFSGDADGDNPNIGPLYRGGTYTFNVNAVGHPFYLTTDNGTNYSSGTYFGEYTTGVTGSRTDNGTVTITVDANAPDTLYYQCGNHAAMRGAITIKDLAVETNVNGNYVVYAQHDQEGHKTPIELRPIPSLVNQMCIVYDATTGQFVPQDLATYVENTPSFENKIREVAGTAELVVEDGSAVVAKVNVYADSTYLPLTGNNAGDQAFATDSNKLYIWDGSAWQQAGSASTDELVEGSTNLYYTDSRVGTYLSSNGYDTATNIVASITDSAPTTLDTLNELAAALGDDPNFATTTANNIALKAPIANPTFTGTVTVTGDLVKTDTGNNVGYKLGTAASPNGRTFLMLDSDAADGVGVGSDYTYIGSDNSFLMGDLTMRNGSITATNATFETNINSGINSAVFSNTNTGSSVYSQVQFISGGESAYIFKNISSRSANGGAGSLTLWNDGNYPISFFTSSTKRLHIDGGGDISFNNTSGSASLYWQPASNRLGFTTASSGQFAVFNIDDPNNEGFRLGDNTTGKYFNISQYGGSLKVNHWNTSSWATYLDINTDGIKTNYSTSDVAAKFTKTSGSTWNYIEWYSNPSNQGTRYGYVGTTNTGDFEIQADNNNKLLLDTNGPDIESQDNHNFLQSIKSSGTTIAADGYLVQSDDYPNIKPTLNMNFSLSKAFDSRLEFKREQNGPTGQCLATYVGADKMIHYAKQNEPRITHDPLTGECLGLLMEKATTNYMTNSNFAGWSVGVSGDTISFDSSIMAPDGTPGCMVHACGTGSGYHRTFRNVTIPNASGTYYVSVWAKKLATGSQGQGRYFEIEVSGNFANHGAVTYDLQTGATQINTNNNNIVNVTMEEYPNGWYRCGYGCSNLGTTTGTIWLGTPTSMGTDQPIAGDGGQMAALWGIQFEDFTYSGGDGFVTSYIPTGANAETRGRDEIKLNNLDGILKPGQFDHTVLMDFINLKNPPAGQTNFGMWNITGNTSYALLRLDNGGPGQITQQHFNGSTYHGSSYGTSVPGDRLRIASRFKSGDFQTCVNSNLASNSNGTIHPSWQYWVNADIGGTGQYMGKGIFRSVQIWDEALTNSQLQTLTRIGKHT